MFNRHASFLFRPSTLSFALGSLLLVAGFVSTLLPSRKIEQEHTGPLAIDWTVPTPILPIPFDPQSVLTGTEKSQMLLVFSRLVKINDSLQIEPELLDSWTYD